MKYIIILFFVLFTFLCSANPALENDTRPLQSVMTEQERGASQVVDKLILAYNDRNIEAFLDLYAEDVAFYMYPQTLMFTGKKKLIERYGLMFKKTKCLKSTSLKRIIHGNIVIDHESSQVCFNDAGKVDKYSEFVTSYQIDDGKIRKVVFFK
ncbi:nuclear transport factor 2 family protein [Pseudoalteromonas sp. MMG012]|nr:nuclear transport factor 2 family protein [Pseudoalteromonas sp. MMG012]